METWTAFPLLTPFKLEHTDEMEPKYKPPNPDSRALLGSLLTRLCHLQKEALACQV